ncbi:nac transcription factor nam-1 [Phtheirospermum japonicum]|uniref:Nac transcription factor nam-1 n=1 Tax=Phtheirospermum japonicum TaxID=374723 RepID=A0A830CF15_9LAMI|nr:nac transcription factor nam-1 [Phtheirospermum japonicum]
MDSLNFVRDGGNKLPPGFRFEPTDEEIVFQYLARKTFNHPLPAQVIPEINIFSFDPWELPGFCPFFFFFKHLYRSHSSLLGNQTGKATCSGYWKASGSTKRIICSKSMPVVGIRRSLVFYKGRKNTRASRTDWIMHEYCVALSQNSACNNTQRRNNSQGSLVRIGNWTLCRIFLKKRSGIREVDDNDKPRRCDFMSDTDSSSASSSSPHCDSSLYTEVSSSIDNGEDTSRYI